MHREKERQTPGDEQQLARPSLFAGKAMDQQNRSNQPNERFHFLSLFCLFRFSLADRNHQPQKSAERTNDQQGEKRRLGLAIAMVRQKFEGKRAKPRAVQIANYDVDQDGEGLWHWHASRMTRGEPRGNALELVSRS